MLLTAAVLCSFMLRTALKLLRSRSVPRRQTTRRNPLKLFARRAGLQPAASGVTGPADPKNLERLRPAITV